MNCTGVAAARGRDRDGIRCSMAVDWAGSGRRDSWCQGVLGPDHLHHQAPCVEMCATRSSAVDVR